MLSILRNTGRTSAVCLCVVCKQDFEVADRFNAKKVHAGNQCDSCKYLAQQSPTQLSLLQTFNYDEDTGLLTYKRDFYRRPKGGDPTTTHSGGYRVVYLDKGYLAHRIIWLMQTGEYPEFVDHIDHNRTNNSWANLRDASRQENAVNKTLNSNNSSGYVGVSYMPARGKFRASITVGRKSIHLGLFETAEEAYAARRAAEGIYGFHTNHGQK